MSPTLTTFLFEAANFVILAALLGWLLFKPVRAALERRQAEQARQAEETARKLSEADALNQEVRQRHRELEQELDQIRVATRTAAEKQAEEIRASARVAAQHEREAIERRLASLEHQQLERLADGVASAVCETTKRLLEQINGPELERGLVGAACRQLQEFNKGSLGSVTVESAAPLPEELKAEIASALGESAKNAQYHTVPEIVAGVRIRTSEGLVDASATGMSRYAERVLSETLLPSNNSAEEYSSETTVGEMTPSARSTKPNAAPASQNTANEPGAPNA